MITQEEWLRRGRVWSCAAKLVRSALISGELIKATCCEQCGSSDTRLEPAHYDYDQPLNVRWLCRSCHRKWDGNQPKTHTRPVPPLAPRRSSDPERLPRTRNTRLLEALRAQGRTVRWFCQAMGVSRWAFWRIEYGESGAPLDWYDRAATVLGLSVNDVAPQEKVAA